MGQAVLAAAGAGLTIAGGVSEGIAKKTASQIQSAKLKFAADAGRVRGQQIDAAYREELNDVQSTMSAIRASQNVRFDSPTSMALFDKAEANNDAARKQAVSDEEMKALGLEGDAAMTRLLGKSARTTSLLKSAPGAVEGLMKAGSSAYSWMKG
jgi:hypothetical protein